MITISFKLREAIQKDPVTGKKLTPSKEKETPVYMIFGYGWSSRNEIGKRIYKPIIYGTGLKIKPHLWNNKEAKPYYRAKQTRNFSYQNFNTKLDNIENGAKEVFNKFQTNGILPDPETLKKAFEEELREQASISDEDAKRPNLNQYIDRFIEDMVSGERLTEKKTMYSKGFIKTIKNFRSCFNTYQESNNQVLDYDLITIDFYEDFVKYFTEKGYSINTIGRLIKQLKIIMHAARDHGLHNNTEIDRRKFKVMTEQVHNIYLTEEELNVIYNLDSSKLSPEQIKIRDIFLIGCYTAQRFSDYSRIRQKHIKGNFIELIQQKTGEKVIIPIRPELKKILKKYEFNVPKTYEQKVNARIKEVGKIAELDEIIVSESTRGGLKVESKQPKYELIKTHTARRTGCTNMYLAGIPTLDIMKLSGHKTEKEFLKYINVTKKQTADKLSSHPYFSGVKLKIARK